jgi:cytochrome c biogenesis protein CcdA
MENNFMKKTFAALLFVAAIVLGVSFVGSAHSSVDAKDVHQCIYFFYSKGCHSCVEADNYIKTVEAKYPLLEVVRYEISNKTNYALLIEFYNSRNIGTYRWPVVFIGNEILPGKEEIQSRLEPLLENKTGWVCPSPNASVPPYPGDEQHSEGTPIAVIAGMAFADSMNPCAITVLLLLIAAIGASTAGTWKIGGAYIAGNFVAYLTIGLGLFAFLHQFEMPAYLNKIIGGAAIALAIYTLFSKIPAQSRPVIKKLINKSTTAPLSFLAGAAISAVELPCTGGPYFLALALMTQYDMGSAEVIAYLLFYNLIFVAPLVAVLVLWGRGIAPKIPKSHIRIVSAALLFSVGMIILLI